MTTLDRPRTTLFMLMSVDGKISTGSGDERDVDGDLLRMEQLKNGLRQYYDIEKTTDLYSLISGETMAKIGINGENQTIEKLPVSFVIVDNKPHIDETGLLNLARRQKVCLSRRRTIIIRR